MSSEDAKTERPPLDPREIPDEAVDRMLGDETFMMVADQMLEQAGEKKLSELEGETQRNTARALFAALAAAKAQHEAAQQGEPPAEPPELPDQMVDDLLADAEIQELLAKVYKENKVETPFAEIPREVHAKLLAMLVAQGIIQVSEVPEQPDPPALSEAQVDALLANPEARKELEKVYEDNNMHAPLDFIDRETHAYVLAQLVARGVIPAPETP